MNECKVCRERAWPTEERGPVVDTCTDCGEPSCDWHGKEYRDGFQHDVCRQTPDYSVIDKEGK